jgi:hypothetical protein
MGIFAFTKTTPRRTRSLSQNKKAESDLLLQFNEFDFLFHSQSLCQKVNSSSSSLSKKVTACFLILVQGKQGA